MFLSVFIPLVYCLTGKRKEPAECYRDTTRLLCDWFYDRPSTSSQADQYATTSPQPVLSPKRRNGRSDMDAAPNTVYPESDQYWNNRYKQGLENKPGLLPRRQIWCGGMTTPFQTAMPNLCAAFRTDVEVSSDEGSSVDPSYTPLYKADDGTGSTGHLQPCWNLVDDCHGLD